MRVLPRTRNPLAEQYTDIPFSQAMNCASCTAYQFAAHRPSSSSLYARCLLCVELRRSFCFTKLGLFDLLATGGNIISLSNLEGIRVPDIRWLSLWPWFSFVCCWHMAVFVWPIGVQEADSWECIGDDVVCLMLLSSWSEFSYKEAFWTRTLDELAKLSLSLARLKDFFYAELGLRPWHSMNEQL